MIDKSDGSRLAVAGIWERGLCVNEKGNKVCSGLDDVIIWGYWDFSLQNLQTGGAPPRIRLPLSS